MKKLSEILEQKRNGFPMQGQNGYAGEMDGTTVTLGTFSVASRKEAENVIVPDRAEIHWANYHAGSGWFGAIGIWSDQIEEKEIDNSQKIDWM